jgi:catechol 2,3-dioxygenase-like lactoylglutathione lyase family enzyme
MPKAIGIDHIAVYVSRMEDAKKFFVEGLGLSPDGDYGDEYFMLAGSQRVAIFQGTNKDQTINHLAFKVDNIEEVTQRLKKLGYHFYQSDCVEGPNGLRIQLVP